MSGVVGKWREWVVPGCLALAVTVLLAVGCPDYLRRIEALSLFVATPLMMDDYWATPGGPLELAARWLTQLFGKPWLGAAVYALLLAAIQWAGCKAFRLRGWWRMAFLAVPLLLLWSMLGMGYLIFSNKTPGFAFQAPVGVLCAFLITNYELRITNLGGLKTKNEKLKTNHGGLKTKNEKLKTNHGGLKTKNEKLKTIIVIVASGFVGYWLIGFYALLAVACCALAAVIYGNSGAVGKVVCVVVAVATIAVAPPTVFAISSGKLQRQHMYTAALPRASVSQWRLWLPSQPVALTDRDFRLALALDRVLGEGQWQQAAGMLADIGETTRLNVVLADLALMHTGRAADQMFAMPVGDAGYASPLPGQVMHDVALMPMCYHLGQTNLAYRWAMEYAVERGMTVEYLKYLTLCALLNGEQRLADRYLDVLSLTMMHRGWAAKYRRYLSDPQAMADDPALAPILSVKATGNMLTGDDGAVEAMVWNIVRQMPAHNRQQRQLSMLADLSVRDLDAFMAKVPAYVAAEGALPRHFQEAVVLWSALNGTNDYVQWGVDPALVDLYRRNPAAPATYWQYYSR